jgi:hypothetical protein
MVAIKSSRYKWLLAALCIAMVHFLLCKAVIALTLQDPFGHSIREAAPGLGTHILVNVTRILYFPIITLSLYSRNWFPGDMIYIPILANSLFWGIGICLLFSFWRSLARRQQPEVRR